MLTMGRARNSSVVLGRHNANIHFVPFNEAHGKPWFDFTFPLIGRMMYPKQTKLRGVDPKDDATQVAGYLVVDTWTAYWSPAGQALPIFRMENDFAVSESVGFGPAIVSVPLPRSNREGNGASLVIKQPYPEIVNVSVRINP